MTGVRRRPVRPAPSRWVGPGGPRAPAEGREGPAGSAYAGKVQSPDQSKRKPPSSFRNRIARAAGRAAESMDLDPESALEAARATLEWSIRHRGPDSSMAIKAKSEVAHQLERSGRYDEAVELRADVVAQLQRLLGMEHPSTLAAEGFHALDLDRLGRHIEARPIFEHVLAGRTDGLGADDPLTLLAMEWLGCNLRRLGDLDESRRLLESAVDSYERLGAGQTEECTKTRSHLATTAFEMGQFSEACVQRRRIVSVRTETSGPDDPSTLRSLENLAGTLRWLDEIDEAKLIYESLLEKRIRLLGPAHPETERTREMLSALENGAQSAP
jgi:tetratricopeptide (TPR) repeat protein